MRYYDESPEEAIERICKERRIAAGYIAPLRRTLDTFGGKVYNKRFLDALRKAAGYERIYDDRRAELVYIYVYAGSSYSAQYTLCCIPLTDRRIQSKQAIQSATERYTKLLKEAASIEEIAPQVDTYRKQLDDLDRLRSKIIGSMPYEVRDIYGIR